MIYAYILLNVRPGKEQEIAEKLLKSHIENGKILDVTVVYGEYDIVIKLETNSIATLRNIVIESIRQLEGVERTTTLISTDLD